VSALREGQRVVWVGQYIEWSELSVAVAGYVCHCDEG
jgi:hypothetical protein